MIRFDLLQNTPFANTSTYFSILLLILQAIASDDAKEIAYD